MAQDDSQEKTEEPTPKKEREAREKGNIPRSRELNTLLMMMASAAGLIVFGENMVKGLYRAFEIGFLPDREHIFDTKYMLLNLGSAVAEAYTAIAPFLLLTVVIALLGPLLVGGWGFSVQAIMFKWDKLDPIKGLGRLFGWQGLMELVKGLAKFTLVLAAVCGTLWYFAPEVLGLGGETVEQGIGHAGELVLWIFLLSSSGLILIAAVDVPFQLWNHQRQLKMSRQEIRDEHKDTEGKPEVKRKIREAQTEMARRRMMAEVPKADVIITNPTHFAVALKYDPKTMAAPIVLAKGADLVAGEIRRIAVLNKVPLMSSPALARSIFYTTEINAQVPAGLYKAVAMVLAYVFQVRRKRHFYTGRPLTMGDVPIPEDLRRDAPPSESDNGRGGNYYS